MHTEYDIRMKEYYENRSKTFLTRRTPVIIRVDGKGFHNFCRRFKKPYDSTLNNSMSKVMAKLCKEIQGAKFGQRHSDEISVLVTDFDTLATDAYFDYNVQKICSIVASTATAEFCRVLVPKIRLDEFEEEGSEKRLLSWEESWPTFDCRCFNIPQEEVGNYFWWRILDAKRGSINMTGQANFSHKELQGKSCDDIQEMLFTKKGINWANLPQEVKTGTICTKNIVTRPIPAGPEAGKLIERSEWMVTESPKTRSQLEDMLIPLLQPQVIELEKDDEDIT